MAKNKNSSNWANHGLNFLAVILGVYFAFYINERSKQNDQEKEAVQLMQSMVKDLSADLQTYKEYQIPLNKKYLGEMNGLFNSLKFNDLNPINQQMSKLFQVENYTPNTSTYNSMRNSGKLRLMPSINLQKKLGDYYEGLVLECEKKNEIQIEFFMSEMVNWLTYNADLLEMKLLEDGKLVVFRNKLLIYQSLIDQKIKNYEMIVKESSELKKQLDDLILANS